MSVRGSSHDLGSSGFMITTFSLIFVLRCSITITHVGASIHDYQNETFMRRANSFFFHGGSEGLYASRVSSSNDSLPSEDNKSLNGKSFIRQIRLPSFLFLFLIFGFFFQTSFVFSSLLVLGVLVMFHLQMGCFDPFVFSGKRLWGSSFSRHPFLIFMFLLLFWARCPG